MNIFEKLSAITNELAVVGKNLEVQVSKTSSYKAVGELDVLTAVKPLEQKHKIYSYPVKRIIVESKEVTTQSQYGEKTQQFIRIETTYRFVNIENPDEYIEVISYGDGLDSGDKACGKAMTYADKYALMKAYKIMTGDDPDQFGSPDSTKAKDETKPNKNNNSNQDDKPKQDDNYRHKLIDYCRDFGIDMTTLAKENNLTKNSTNDEYKKVYEKLINEFFSKPESK